MFSQNKGWVRLHRKIEDSPLWFSEQFTKAQAWIDLFLFANHARSIIFIRGIEVVIERGQIAWSEITMSKRWKWSRKRVRNFLKYLEKEQQITISQNRFVTTLITIINYENHQKDTTKDTAEEQQKNSKGYINNNNKNEKNDKKLYMECVYLSDDEYKKLLSQYKEPGTNKRIENLNLYIMSKGKKYKSHYHTILSWDRKNNKQDKPTTNLVTSQQITNFFEGIKK